MAKITIELDTAMGDTLQRALDSLELKEKERWITHTIDRSRDFTTGPVASVVVKTSVEGVETSQKPVSDTENAARGEPEQTNSEMDPALGMTDMDGDRKRGEAGPGHRRRTNKQIAEDEVYFAAVKARADAAIKEMEKGVHIDGPEVKLANGGVVQAHLTDGVITSLTVANPTSETIFVNPAAISSGDERVNPEDEAQDAADEAAESAAAPKDTLTHEDLRAAIGRFTKTHGIAVAQKRIPDILGCAVIELPSDRIGDAIAVIDAEAAVPPKKAEQKFEPVVAQKEDVEEAMRQYAKKYDGTLDQKLMVFTAQDVPAILTKVFGPAVKVPKQIEPKTPENYGKALAAINDAISTNPFGRTAK